MALMAGRFTAAAQQAYSLSLHRLDSSAVPQDFMPESTYATADLLVSKLQQLIPQLQEQGFLAASIDSISIGDHHYDAYLFTGPVYKWGHLNLSEIPQALFTGAGIDPAVYNGQALRPVAIAQLSEKILQYCDNNGYPFARVWLDQVQEQSPGRINATLRADPAEFRKIDTVIIEGDISVSRTYLLRYLDLQQGSVYSEKKLRILTQRLQELPFLKEAAPWSVTFKPGETRITLALEERKANQLNAILGLMPNNLETGKLLFTADIQLALQNLLGHGESIAASYQNLQYRSPRLKADLSWPYLFNTAFGADAHFDLFRNNLQFRKLSFQGGLRYQFSASDYARLYYQVLDNRIITVDTATIMATHALPDNIDAHATGPGVELALNRTDYRLNPHKGWYGRLSVTGLQRKIIRNSGITGITDASGFDYNSLYDTVSAAKYQYIFSGEAGAFLPLGPALTIKIAYCGGYIASPNIFRNELFQIGGFKLLRGFDEQSLFVNQYHVAVAELRLRISRNSYAYAFNDNGWLQSRYSTTDRAGLYDGFGLGTTLETKTGIFTLAYALGRSDFNPLRFRESKLLFGYVALF